MLVGKNAYPTVMSMTRVSLEDNGVTNPNDNLFGGGAMYLHYVSDVIIRESNFSNNFAKTTNGGAAKGYSIYSTSGSAGGPTITIVNTNWYNTGWYADNLFYGKKPEGYGITKYIGTGDCSSSPCTVEPYIGLCTQMDPNDANRGVRCGQQATIKAIMPGENHTVFTGIGFGTSSSSITIRVGGVLCTQVTWVSDTEIRAIPPLQVGEGEGVNLTVGGKTFESSVQFSIVPLVSSIESPNCTNDNGDDYHVNKCSNKGPVVIIHGRYFDQTGAVTRSVKVGSLECTPTSWTSTKIVCNSPAGVDINLIVTVTARNGMSNTNDTNASSVMLSFSQPTTAPPTTTTTVGPNGSTTVAPFTVKEELDSNFKKEVVEKCESAVCNPFFIAFALLLVHCLLFLYIAYGRKWKQKCANPSNGIEKSLELKPLENKVANTANQKSSNESELILNPLQSSNDVVVTVNSSGEGVGVKVDVNLGAGSPGERSLSATNVSVEVTSPNPTASGSSEKTHYDRKMLPRAMTMKRGEI